MSWSDPHVLGNSARFLWIPSNEGLVDFIRLNELLRWIWILSFTRCIFQICLFPLFSGLVFVYSMCIYRPKQQNSKLQNVLCEWDSYCRNSDIFDMMSLDLTYITVDIILYHIEFSCTLFLLHNFQWYFFYRVFRLPFVVLSVSPWTLKLQFPLFTCVTVLTMCATRLRLLFWVSLSFSLKAIG